MIALQYSRFGDAADVVAPVEIERPEPSDGQVVLRMLRSPIHNHDLATIRGVYGHKPQLPAIAGSEIAGVIEKLGPGVTHLHEGQRVVFSGSACWAQYVVAPAMGCLPVPDGIGDDVASQLLAMPLSAVVLLDELRVEPGDWIAQTAAGGAVGRAMMRLAQARGINVVNVVRRNDTVEELRKFGAQHAVATEEDEAWPELVRALVGDAGLARVIDSVVDKNAAKLERLLGPRGEYVIFGALGGSALQLDPGPLIFHDIVVRGFWMSSWMLRATHAERMAVVERTMRHVAAGDIPLPVAEVHPLADARDALRAAERPGRTGKILFKS